jgi:hypothetical protein
MPGTPPKTLADTIRSAGVDGGRALVEVHDAVLGGRTV